MMNLLYWSGISEAGNLLKENGEQFNEDSDNSIDDNKPLAKLKFREITDALATLLIAFGFLNNPADRENF